MNERIQQLAQAYLEHERFDRLGESTQEDHYVFYPDELAEFVESIVEECADFARQHNMEKADRSHLIHRAIKQHFGVDK
jgi:hypothetical protein